MNPMLLKLMSGPLMALARYAVSSAGAAVIAHGWTDGATVTNVSAGLIALASAGIGALTSTKSAKVVTAAALPGVKLTLPNGTVVSDGAAAATLVANDPTWDNPNAR